MKQLKGEAGFDAYYSEVFGSDWSTLKASLLMPARKTKLLNPFVKNGASQETNSHLGEFYELDPASLLVASAVGVECGQNVLDLCASPGGKSLAMYFSVIGEANFTLNDLSHDRVQRLRRVLAEFLPDVERAKIRVTCHDGSRWGLYEKEIYDRILLDAPCSGERHVLEDAKALRDWGVKRSSGLATRQFALLCSALMALKVGGRMVYSTCTLSPKENDEVIAKLLNRREGQVRVLADALQGLDGMNDKPNVINSGPMTPLKTKYGFMIRPDLHDGAGPMYFSVLEKMN